MARALEGQVVIVTGGGTGIGRVTALLAAAEGAHVVIAGRRREPLDSVVAEIEKDKGLATAHAVDLERPEEAVKFAESVVAAHRRVDVLVNNAGHSSTIRHIRWVRREDWESVFAVNVTAVYTLTQAVLPSMIERGGGTIITVSSVAAISAGLLGGAPYGAAKAAVRNLMSNIHVTCRDKGIRATTIMPAEVDTPILDKRPLPPDVRARATMMQAEDVARTILFCATMPARTVLHEIVMYPTIQRDVTADIATAAQMGAPPGAR